MLCGFAYVALESLHNTYDPLDAEDHPYAPLLLKALSWPALHIAVVQGDEEAVARLLGQGADPEERNHRGNTALHEAAKRGRGRIIDQLLQRGIPVDVRGVNAMTPLHQAVWFGHVDAAKRLLAHGASLSLKGTPQASTALHLAVDRADADMVQLLLESGANIHDRNRNMETPLHVAAWQRWNDNTEVAELLLDYGADLDARDDLGFAPLNRAAREGSTKLASLLVLQGADVESQTIKETTPLYQAAWAGDIATVRLLLDHGAKVNARNIDRYSPLKIAVLQNHVEVARLLLERGADPSQKLFGLYAWRDAEGNGREEMLRMLTERGARIYPSHMVSFNFLLVSGSNAHKQGLYQQALESYNQAAAQDAGDPQLYYLQAESLIGLNSFAEARRDLGKAIALEPTYYEAYRSLAGTFQKEGNWNEAMKVWNRLIALSPKHAQAHYERGVIRLEQRHASAVTETQAIEDLTRSCRYGFQKACALRMEVLQLVPS